MSLAMDRHPVSFWVRRFKVMTREEADALIATLTDQPPHKFVDGLISGGQPINYSWHGKFNRETSKVAYNHVYDGAPLPVSDERDDAVGELVKQRDRLKAMSTTRGLKAEIAELKEGLATEAREQSAEKRESDEGEETPTGDESDPGEET